MSRFHGKGIDCYLLSLVWAAVIGSAATSETQAFPLWAKGNEAPETVGKSKDRKGADSNGADSNGSKGAPGAGGSSNATPAPAASSVSAKSDSAKGGTVQILVPVDFSPGAGAFGSGTTTTDPMAIYRDAGINLEKERKIRQLSKEFESMQRVRLKLLSNLLDDMKHFELQSDPDPKAVMEKQNEINKLSATMANDRVKLLLDIRHVMSHDEKERLVESLQRGSGAKPQN